jgi:hypothetical protein
MPEQFTSVQEERDLDTLEKDTLKKIQDILNFYGGNESNIGIHDRYWYLKNQYRALINRPSKTQR